MIDVDLGSNLLGRFWCSLILCKLLVLIEVAEGESFQLLLDPIHTHIPKL